MSARSALPDNDQIHFEILDGATSRLLTYGSTNSLNVITAAAWKARADNAGAWIEVNRVSEPNWKLRTDLPTAGTPTEQTRMNRVSAALGDLRDAVAAALDAGITPETLPSGASLTRPNLQIQIAIAHRDLAPQPDFPNNEDRANAAAQAAAVFGRLTGQIDPPDGPIGTELVEQIASDLACDLLHLVEHIGGNAAT